MSAVEWCQCEHADHDAAVVMCTCPHTPSGVRFASKQCPVHAGVAHPYGRATRDAQPVLTTFGTFHLCKPCRDAGHMTGVGVSE